MTIPHDTTAKLIGLAATGAAMLGYSLEDALLTDPAELTALIRHLTGSGEATGAAAPTPAAVLPTQPRPAAPVAEKRTSLIRPGMTIPAGDVDPEDESLYI